MRWVWPTTWLVIVPSSGLKWVVPKTFILSLPNSNPDLLVFHLPCFSYPSARDLIGILPSIIVTHGDGCLNTSPIIRQQLLEYQQNIQDMLGCSARVRKDAGDPNSNCGRWWLSLPNAQWKRSSIQPYICAYNACESWDKGIIDGNNAHLYPRDLGIAWSEIQEIHKVRCFEWGLFNVLYHFDRVFRGCDALRWTCILSSVQRRLWPVTLNTSCSIMLGRWRSPTPILEKN
jgi:hypothetical protein